MAKKNTYNITLNVKVEVDKAADGKRIPWISFKAWKHGIMHDDNLFIDTGPMVKRTDNNLKYVGQQIFDAAKEMFYEDEKLEN